MLTVRRIKSYIAEHPEIVVQSTKWLVKHGYLVSSPTGYSPTAHGKIIFIELLSSPLDSKAKQAMAIFAVHCGLVEDIELN